MNRMTALPIAIVALPWGAAAAQQATYVPVPTRAASASAHVLRRNAIATVPLNVDSMLLRPGEFFALRVAPGATERESARGGELKFDVPILFKGVDASGVLFDARPSVEVEGGGLRYAPDRAVFVGTILLGLQSVSQPTGTQQLGRRVQVLITASADSIDSAQVSLDHTNLPYKRIRLVALTAPPDTVQVSIRTDFDATPVVIRVPVLRPVLTVVASPKRIAGFGLEVAALAIEARGVRRPDSLVVILSAGKGRIDTMQVALSRSGTAASSIRSSGLGRDTVKAQSQSLLPAQEIVDFVFPWGFLVAAIIGGLVGGLIHQSRLSGKPRAQWIEFVVGVLIAALAGMVIAVGYAFGVNAGNIPPTKGAGEGLVFFTAAYGAIQGIPVAAKLVQRAKARQK